MSRLRPRFNRRMFREPELRDNWSAPLARSDVVDDYKRWLRDTRSQDPQAFRYAAVYGPGNGDESNVELPAGLRSRVIEMQRRLTASEANFEDAYRSLRPARTEARRYTPRKGR